MVVTCNIEFDNNPHGTFFAGQMLAGRITMTSDKLKEVKGLALYVNGYACTDWSETKFETNPNNRLGNKIERHTGYEDYITSLTYLLGSADNSQKLRIEPGIHTYNFACQLPTTCPSSFEGTYGHVRYKVKVALERPWKFDQTYTRCFTVLKTMDQNYKYSPLLRMPANTEIQKTYCYWPCASEPMRLQLSLPQRGFVAGQLIPVKLLVINNTRIAVEEVQIALVMTICYYSQCPSSRTRNERISVLEFKGDKVCPHCTKKAVYDLCVPATPPTCFDLSRIIQIAYQIEVECKVKGWHRNEVLRVPLTIGSVPLLEVVQQQPAMSQHSEVLLVPAAVAEVPTSTSSAQHVSATDKSTDVQLVVNRITEPTASTNSSHTNDSPMPWLTDANIPPPNYEEAAHLRQAIMSVETSDSATVHVEDYGQTIFKPLYPVFNVSSATTTGNGANNDAGVLANKVGITTRSQRTWF